MNNKKGFTLVEILSIIVLLGLISLLAFPAVDKYINEAKEEIYQNQVNYIILGAKNWAVENKLILPKEEGQEFRITLDTLMNEGFLEFDIKNPKTKKPFSKESEVLITRTKEIYEYRFLPK